jgi:hypothetical protein
MEKQYCENCGNEIIEAQYTSPTVKHRFCSSLCALDGGDFKKFSMLQHIETTATGSTEIQSLRDQLDAAKMEIMEQGDVIVSLGKVLLQPNEREIYEKKLTEKDAIINNLREGIAQLRILIDAYNIPNI